MDCSSHSDRKTAMEDVHYHFKIKVDDLKSKFASLQTVIRQKLELSDSHQKLTDYVKRIEVLNCDHVAQINEVASVDFIFTILITYWSFIDYELLEGIVMSMCLEVKHLMEQYTFEIKLLCKWKVLDMPPDPLCSIAYDETKEKLSVFVNEKDLTLLRVKEIKAIVAGVLSLSPFKLLLYKVQDTCITCIILRSIGEELFKENLTNEQRNEFRRNRVSALQFQEFKEHFFEEMIETQLGVGLAGEPAAHGMCIDEAVTNSDALACDVGLIELGSFSIANHELSTLWEHFNQLVDAITDPDALAEEICRVGLIHPESKRILQSLPVDAKTKARSLLQSMEGKIKDQPVIFNYFLALLKKLPGLIDLGIGLQESYEKKVTASVSKDKDSAQEEDSRRYGGDSMIMDMNVDSTDCLKGTL